MSAVFFEPQVFEPVSGITVEGIPCTTVRPATQVSLLAGVFPQPHHRLARDLLMKHMPPDELELYGSPPFQELRSVLTHTPLAFGR